MPDRPRRARAAAAAAILAVADLAGGALAVPAAAVPAIAAMPAAAALPAPVIEQRASGAGPAPAPALRPRQVYDPVYPDQLMPDLLAPSAPSAPQPPSVVAAVSDEAAPAGPSPGPGLDGFEPTAEDQYRIAAASLLKDVTPFAPGSGPNTTGRMGEWLAADRSIANARSARAYAVAALDDHGWGLEEWPALDRLWWHESGWAPVRADGDTARAWGIPQALPASKMAPYGDDYLTSPATQIRWGLDYIAQRYGSPTRAWEFWKAQAANGGSGWY